MKPETQPCSINSINSGPNSGPVNSAVCSRVVQTATFLGCQPNSRYVIQYYLDRYVFSTNSWSITLACPSLLTEVTRTGYRTDSMTSACLMHNADTNSFNRYKLLEAFDSWANDDFLQCLVNIDKHRQHRIPQASFLYSGRLLKTGHAHFKHRYIERRHSASPFAVIYSISIMYQKCEDGNYFASNKHIKYLTSFNSFAGNALLKSDISSQHCHDRPSHSCLMIFFGGLVLSR